MNCLTKLSQKKRVTKSYIRAFLATMISKRDSSGFSWEKSILKISNMPSRSSNNFIYSGSVTVTPCSLITWTIGGEFYRNQIEEEHYKKMFMLDTKLTFNISKRIEVSASITNLLNKKEYSYTSYGTVSQYERSSKLRGREFMISIYLKK